MLEIDQNAALVGDLLADLRLRKAIGMLAVALLAIPISYLVGGRSLHRRQRRAEHAADTDALTGICGRRPFRPHLEGLLDRAGTTPVALALLDIDEFKQVNDRLGHSYGDRVLVALADALQELRATDAPYRLGSDEFAILLPGADDDEASAVIQRVRRRFTVSTPGITFSCGIASASPDEVTPPQELWERADSARYESKRQGRRRTTTFTQVSNRVCVTQDKLDALERLLRGEADVDAALQSVWALEEGRLLAHEALLRLPAELGFDGPSEAFALAERLRGRVDALDTLARQAVLRAVGRLAWEGALAVNLHPGALRTLDVEALVADLAAAGLAPAQVILEVTEHPELDRAEDIRTLERAQEVASASRWTTWARATPASRP
jgi:diguanylate cyclase (GGDEF)-like protein